MAVMGNCIANWDMRRQARVVLPEFWPVPEMRRRLGKDFIGYGVWGLMFDGKITFFFPHAKGAGASRKEAKDSRRAQKL